MPHHCIKLLETMIAPRSLQNARPSRQSGIWPQHIRLGAGAPDQSLGDEQAEPCFRRRLLRQQNQTWQTMADDLMHTASAPSKRNAVCAFRDPGLSGERCGSRGRVRARLPAAGLEQAVTDEGAAQGGIAVGGAVVGAVHLDGHPGEGRRLQGALQMLLQAAPARLLPRRLRRPCAPSYGRPTSPRPRPGGPLCSRGLTNGAGGCCFTAAAMNLRLMCRRRCLYSQCMLTWLQWFVTAHFSNKYLEKGSESRTRCCARCLFARVGNE